MSPDNTRGSSAPNRRVQFMAWRRETLSRPLFAWYKKVLPPVSDTEREALEAGTVWWDAELFSGKPKWSRLLQAPKAQLRPEEQAFLDGPVEQLCAMLDDWRINFEWHDLPPEAWSFIRENRFFGMIIPKAYGGLEFSALAHSAVVAKIATRSITAAVTVMVPNSLGPAELLLHYGTEAQKNHYLPRLARGDDIPCFALTGPFAGSDAAGIPDVGIVCRGLHEGREVLGLRATWEKRYITLGPVATVMGLALRVRDPDHLLGDEEDCGITVALVPTKTPGVEIGRRHYPVHQAFMNGPNRGKDVFIPLEWIVGGEAQIGRGWRMLVESLAAGRGISLPSLSAGGIKFLARVSGAYGRVRKQFGLSVGKFEGVQEALARIAGSAYMAESLRRVTAVAVDMGEKPSVITAIAKLHATTMMRHAINDAMDIHGGKGICEGPSNYMANIYHAMPVSITVEGANILTRSLIVFGQGAIRCHPFITKEMAAARNPDPEAGLDAFDAVIWKHARHQVTTLFRSLWHNVTGAITAIAPRAGRASVIYGKLTRASVNFAVCAETAMILLGGDLKRRESLSARLGDALANMYLLSCCLKRYEDEGRQKEDFPLLSWCAATTLKAVDDALAGVLANLPMRPLAWLLRPFARPWWGVPQSPSDKLSSLCAELLLSPSPVRDRLTSGTYVGSSDQPVGQLEAAFHAVMAADEVSARMKAAGVRDPETAEARGILNAQDVDTLALAATLTRKVIMVDDFAPEDLSPRWNQSRP